MDTTTTDPRPSVDSFDVEAWIAGRTIPTRTVRVTNDPGLQMRFALLETELRQALDAGNGKPRVPGARAGARPDTVADQVRAKMRALLAETEASWATITVRAVTPAESAELSQEPTRIGVIVASLTVAGTLNGVALDRDGWARVLDAIGVTQTLSVEAALNECAGAVVTPDFSERASSLLDGDDSSPS